MNDYDGPSFDKQYGPDDETGPLVEQVKSEQTEQAYVVEESIELRRETTKVQIVDAFGLGFFFGLGLIMALVLPAFIVFVIFMMVLNAATL